MFNAPPSFVLAARSSSRRSLLSQVHWTCSCAFGAPQLTVAPRCAALELYMRTVL
jgi:hypothetical protein